MSLVQMYQPGQNCRTVFWSWPAEKIRLRLARDIREKIAVTAASGKYMAMFLRQLKPQSHVCMVGFSFGNRIICDAVERLGDDRPDEMQIHLVLTASATDRGWLASGSRHGNVPRLVEKILILYNPADFALKFYPLLYGNGSRHDALGRFGPPMARIAPEYRDRIEAFNVQPYIGTKHLTVYHLKTPVFRQRMNDYLFFDE
jgi:esterase/lipase superfamily enzyme